MLVELSWVIRECISSRQRHSRCRICTWCRTSMRCSLLKIVFTLRMKAASAKLVEKAVAHDSWPIHRDILYPPPQRLSSRQGRNHWGTYMCVGPSLPRMDCSVVYLQISKSMRKSTSYVTVLTRQFCIIIDRSIYYQFPLYKFALQEIHLFVL